MKIPPIKKTIKRFILNEQGKITSNSLIKLGVYSMIAASSAMNVMGGGYCENMGPDNQIAHASARCGDDCWSLHESCHASGGYNIEFQPKEIEGYEIFDYDFEDHISDSISFKGGCGAHQSASWISVTKEFPVQCHSNDISLKTETHTILAEHSHDIADCGAQLNIGASHCNEPPCHASATCHLNYDGEPHSNGHQNGGGGGGGSPSP